MKFHALVIDDTPEVLDDVKDRLESLGHTCDCATSVNLAREHLAKTVYSYILLDLEIPVRYGRPSRITNGQHLLREIQATQGYEDVPIIVITSHGHDSSDLPVEVMRGNGAVDFVRKPFPERGHTLEKAVQDALANKTRIETSIGAAGRHPRLGQSERARSNGADGWSFEPLHEGEVRARNEQLCKDYTGMDEHDLLAISASWRHTASSFVEATKRTGHYQGHVQHAEEIVRPTKILETALSHRDIDGVNRLGRCLRRPDDGHLHWALASLDELDAKLRAEASLSAQAARTSDATGATNGAGGVQESATATPPLPRRKQTKKQAQRDATVGALKRELHQCILAHKSALSAADDADRTYDLPDISQRQLAAAIGATESSVSRAIRHSGDRELQILLQTTKNPDMIRKYAR